MYEYVVARGEFAGYCVATDRFVLALHPGLQGSISAIWPLLHSPETHLEEIFARLIERGVSQAPDFAIAEIVDPVQRAVSAVVHGHAIAQLLDDPASAVSGQGLSTWRESIWTGVHGFLLGVGDDRSGLERLPITGGVVRADWIRWAADEPALRDATIVAETVSRPAEAGTGNGGAVPTDAPAPEPGTRVPTAAEAPPAAPAESPAAPRPTPKRSRVRQPAADAASAPTPGSAAYELDESLEDTVPSEPSALPTGAAGPDADREPEPFLGNILAVPGIRLPDGSVVPAELPLVVGRNPRIGLSASGAPTVPVIVASPRRTISSSHLQVEAAGRAVLLKDLGTRNGSLVRKPRSQAFVLAGGAEALVPVGTTVELGDGVAIEVVIE